MGKDYHLINCALVRGGRVSSRTVSWFCEMHFPSNIDGIKTKNFSHCPNIVEPAGHSVSSSGF